MKIYISFLCFIFSNGAFSQTENKVRLKTIGSVNYFYKYDEKGRVSQIKASDKNYYDSYTYLGDTAIVIQHKDYIDSALTEIYLLNDKNLVDTKTKIYADNKYLFISNQFDNNNQLTRQTAESDFRKSLFLCTNKNGNTIVQIAQDTIFENGKFQISSSKTISTFSDKLNPLTNQLNGMSFEGEENKNLIIGDKYEINRSDFCDKLPCPFLPEKREIVEYKYEYEFDEKARLKTYISINTKTMEKAVTKYYYY